MISAKYINFKNEDAGKDEQVLDIGCGAGVDTILAAIMVGPKGSVIGVDIVSEMIARAESNLQMMELDNVTFQKYRVRTKNPKGK